MPLAAASLSGKEQRLYPTSSLARFIARCTGPGDGAPITDEPRADTVCLAGRQHPFEATKSRARTGRGVVEDPGTTRNSMHENRASRASIEKVDRSAEAPSRNADMLTLEESQQRSIRGWRRHDIGLRTSGTLCQELRKDSAARCSSTVVPQRRLARRFIALLRKSRRRVPGNKGMTSPAERRAACPP